jgi:hypothetical protein
MESRLRHLSVRALVPAVALLLGLSLLTITQPADATASSLRVDGLEQQIHALRAQTWRWQRLMRKPRTPSSFSERHAESPTYLTWVRNHWQRHARVAARQAKNPPHRDEWLCIQRHERHPAQGWATYTGNGYYGGLQMDISFQRTYGSDLLRRKGTANNWTAVEQMWVAERAFRSGVGFYPWPNTARTCGLI